MREKSAKKLSYIIEALLWAVVGLVVLAIVAAFVFRRFHHWFY